ncbi:MAG TPA: ATP-binding protein [Anaerolineales bacterium]
MSLFFNQLLTFLTAPPGNLIYHFVLVISIAGTLQGAIHLLSSSQFPQAWRTVFGLGILLGLQVILFIVSGLAWPGLFDPKTVLAPLDRAVTLLALVWIIWLWAFPEPVLLADSVTVLLSLLVVPLFGLTLAFWAQNPGMSFNLSTFEIIWQGFSLAAVLLGILVLAIRRPNSWGNGLAMLLLAFSGHLLTLIWRMDGDFPGFVRLTQLALFPILLTILQRFPASASVRKPVVNTENIAQGPVLDRQRYSTDSKTFQALMSLAAEVPSDKIGYAMTREIAQAMMADLCFLLTLAEDKSLSIACGYDLIREENLDGAPVNKDAIPLLTNTIQRGHPLRLPTSSTSSDLKGLGKMLGLNKTGNLLSVPITSPERGPLGGILILSPYSNRLWNAEDQTFLSNVSTLFIPILERGQRTSQSETERDHALQEAQPAQEQAVEANRKYEETAKELEMVNDKVSQSQVQVENMAALLAMQEKTLKTIESLKLQIEQMCRTGEVGDQPDDSPQLERELRQTMTEMARMQNALADANAKILELEKHPISPIASEQLEVIASISQELRQPMSSIVGYTDLLLGESVGILGALQRKFMERIKASTERIGSLVDDLIRITNLETIKMEFKAESIDLNLIIDNAMVYTSTQIREKNITLRLDIPETALRIQTNQDALQQIFIHLFQNATAATQVEGVITLRIQMLDESNMHYLSIQVTDTGGGIASDDIPRVFARRYRVEQSLIQGLGDPGVGLSIAKVLVEAQGGRMWVETKAGIGSTFSILLPVLLEPEGEK